MLEFGRFFLPDLPEPLPICVARARARACLAQGARAPYNHRTTKIKIAPRSWHRGPPPLRKNQKPTTNKKWDGADLRRSGFGTGSGGDRKLRNFFPKLQRGTCVSTIFRWFFFQIFFCFKSHPKSLEASFPFFLMTFEAPKVLKKHSEKWMENFTPSCREGRVLHDLAERDMCFYQLTTIDYQLTTNN